MTKTMKYPDPSTAFCYAVAFIVEAINDGNATLDEIASLQDYDIREFAENSSDEIPWEFDFSGDEFELALKSVNKFAILISTGE